jgi:hypothetical protein
MGTRKTTRLLSIPWAQEGDVVDNATFWRLIDSSRKKAKGDLDEHVNILRQQLEQLDADEIVQFDKIFRQYWARAYTWDLWGAAYIIGGGCSDDGFLDFRAWLISKGEKTYEDALKDPESLVRVVKEDDDDCQYEGFQYVASQAWEAKTARGMKEFPDCGVFHAAEPVGEKWAEEGDELERRFPKLWKEFSQ